VKLREFALAQGHLIVDSTTPVSTDVAMDRAVARTSNFGATDGLVDAFIVRAGVRQPDRKP
jgi:hypothetical protein